MRKIFILSVIVIIALTSCDNSEFELSNSNEKRELLFTNVESSVQTQSLLTTYLRLEYAEYFVDAETRNSDPSIYAVETDEMFKDYDLSTQLVVTSDTKDGKAIFIQKTDAKNEFLAFYQDKDGNILSIKKMLTQIDGDYGMVSLKRIDDSEFISAIGNSKLNSMEILSYDESVFGQATTRNGCSFCLWLCSIPWAAGATMCGGFVAGIAVELGYQLLSEAIC